jgi:hypothetical protein
LTSRQPAAERSWSSHRRKENTKRLLLMMVMRHHHPILTPRNDNVPPLIKEDHHAVSLQQQQEQQTNELSLPAAVAVAAVTDNQDLPSETPSGHAIDGHIIRSTMEPTTINEPMHKIRRKIATTAAKQPNCSRSQWANYRLHLLEQQAEATSTAFRAPPPPIMDDFSSNHNRNCFYESTPAVFPASFHPRSYHNLQQEQQQHFCSHLSSPLVSSSPTSSSSSLLSFHGCMDARLLSSAPLPPVPPFPHYNPNCTVAFCII